MGKILGWTGAVLVVAALCFGLWGVWPVLFPPATSGWLSQLAKADAALLQNRYDQAKKLLNEPEKGFTVTGWLQWEKRVQAVGSKTGNWPWAAGIAVEAHSQFPGNPELAAYAVWTLLKIHKVAEASTLAEKVLRGTRWEGLARQARIEAGGLASGDWTDLRTKISEPSAEAYQLYNSLAALAPEPALQKNALLSALALGRLEDARLHLDVLSPEERDQPPFDRLKGLMAYDQGDWTRAAALLKNLSQDRPENLLVLADVYLHLGDKDQAKIIYDQLLAEKFTRLVPTSVVVNRATLALDDGDPSKALEFLNMPRDPEEATGSPALMLLTLEARYQLGEKEAVKKALDDLIRSGQETETALGAELLKDRLFPEWNSNPRLWSLLHRHPAAQPLAERLVWNLLVDQDYPGAHRALDLHEQALAKMSVPTPWWLLEQKAMLLAVENRLSEGSDAFSQVPKAWQDSTFFANWSLVTLVMAEQSEPDTRQTLLEDSLTRQTKALDLMPPSVSTSALKCRSRWLSRRGDLENALVPLENPAQRGTLRSAAAEDFRQAVQLDPENLRASFLLRQVLAVNQEKQ